MQKVTVQHRKDSELRCRYNLSSMFHVLSRRLRRLCSSLSWWIWRRPRPKLVISRFRRLNSRNQFKEEPRAKFASRPVRLATFNAALFSLAPAVPRAKKSIIFVHGGEDDWKNNLVKSSAEAHPKGILKSPLHPTANGPETGSKSKPKVSINLPENEISLAQNKVLSFVEDSPNHMALNFSSSHGSLAAMRSPIIFPPGMSSWMNDEALIGSRTIYDVLKEVDADILALQDVKAEEEKNMRPLSDLAHALGMRYVFAESWAPEYGNAILSKWPIKKWKVQKIYDDRDFRNVLKATIDVPGAGEMNFYCTQLDHLDEYWRMKQINVIIQSNDQPHILAGGLNSLDGSDYSLERWTNIVKYYEESGKPTPKAEVMNFLKGKKYVDPKEFAGECEPVVIIAKGQNVQGTCKYGTRVDYILASPGTPYKFVPGSYSVISSKGTSDHHLVKVEVIKVADNAREVIRQQKKRVKQRVVRLTSSCSSGTI